MKTLIIPDLHGKTIWKEAIKKFSVDRVVFLGDYLDSFDHSDEELYLNFLEIIKLKKLFPEKIELLLGNHEVHYMFYPRYRCSGFRPNLANKVIPEFSIHGDLFKASVIEQDYLITHAGVTKSWMNYYLNNFNRFVPEDFDTIADFLNALLKTQESGVLFVAGKARYGYFPFGGPFWADKSEFELHKDNSLDGYKQIVGHSRIKTIEEINDVFFVDCLDTMNEFLMLNNGEPELVYL